MSATQSPGNEFRHSAPPERMLPVAKAVVRYGALVAVALLLILIILPLVLGAAAAAGT
jgi:hypothetical protein